MLAKISFQKVIAVIISVIILIAFIFGIVTRESYLFSSRDKSKISTAELQLSEDFSSEYNNIYSSVDFDTALSELEQSKHIFYAKCIKSEICYDCIKHTMRVIKTIKGDTEETSKEIVLYQLLCFDFHNQKIIFVSPDNTLPLKEGKEYLIFANKRDYYDEYQKRLNKNEYSLCLSGCFPTSLIVNETQNEYVNVSQAKNYSDVENLYYMCYNKTSLNNVNNISQKIINHILEN